MSLERSFLLGVMSIQIDKFQIKGRRQIWTFYSPIQLKKQKLTITAFGVFDYLVQHMCILLAKYENVPFLQLNRNDLC